MYVQAVRIIVHERNTENETMKTKVQHDLAAKHRLHYQKELAAECRLDSLKSTLCVFALAGSVPQWATLLIIKFNILLVQLSIKATCI